MATNNAVMTTDVKLSRCNNQPWGFRLSGGVDFTFPLTVVRVTIGGLAHKAGLEAGDVVIYVNREPISQLTHMQVHDKLVNIGNDIVLSVVHSHEIAQQQQRGAHRIKYISSMDTMKVKKKTGKMTLKITELKEHVGNHTQ
ncbi:PREDICTED: PDZ and LIM domain protein 7-like isoform X2 [Cyphomyrmex costatus]|uniref:PDZ and LIM domain protein 7-like isoform X2 n=1 Tax=Cyphomyrmex costatus TaxID=456900 RepID=UPI0008524656|nr:PREDICTED: PDZ and LIM domain protein 7-like isoform X2 [Cyphomyrmex costatus]